MALRIALHEVEKLVKNGLTKEQFEDDARLPDEERLREDVHRRTSRSATRSTPQWYGIGEYSAHMRAALAKLTVDDVNQAIRKHIRPQDMKIVMITKDAEGLKQKLVERRASRRSSTRPRSRRRLLDEDKVIGAMKLGIRADAVRVIPVEDVFRK